MHTKKYSVRKKQTKKKLNEIDSIIQYRKYFTKILQGKTKYSFNINNLEILEKQYNQFAHRLGKFWKYCQNEENNSKYTNKLINYYTQFKKYKDNVYIKENEELSKSEVDFYDLVKIDNHVHLSALITTKELKEYMEKEQKSKKGEKITVFKMNTIIDQKNIHSKNSCKDRYDFNDFNEKYFIGKKGEKDRINNLRQCFLKVNSGKNKLQRINTSKSEYNIHDMGKFNCRKSHYANITKIISKLRKEKNTHLDLRISLYGKSENELTDISNWFVKNNLHILDNIDWYVQIPRIPHMVLRDKFNETENKFSVLILMYKNIFNSIKKAYKTNDTNKLMFLNKLKGFDSVDNEDEYNIKYYNDPETKIDNKKIQEQLNAKRNPFTYAMYLYFLWYFVSDLNQFIKNKRNIFFLKPHCGELGPLHHLLTAYLLTHSICHGINLIDSESSKIHDPLKILKKNKNNVLLYLYCKSKVGCAISPISNNYLTRSYECLHLDLLFNLGLKLSINTDDPLMFHLTDDPLMEDIIMVKNLYLFSLTDIIELINNSYYINGNFLPKFKLKKRDINRKLCFNKHYK